MSSVKLSSIFLVATMIFAGCLAGNDNIARNNDGTAAETEGGTVEPLDSTDDTKMITLIDAVAWTISDYGCGDEDDVECHIFHVSITNIGNEDLSTSSYYWEAIGDDGGVYSRPIVDGHSKIIPGASTELTLSFDVNSGVKLNVIRFDSYELTDSVSIANYDIIESFNVRIDIKASGLTDPSISSYDCGGDEKNECHLLNVTVNNLGLLDFVSESWDWEAIGDNGAVYSCDCFDDLAIDYEQRITPGSIGNMTLPFDIPNGVKLISLNWENDGLKTLTSIDDYDVVESLNLTMSVDASGFTQPSFGYTDSRYCGLYDDEECHILNVTVFNRGILEYSSFYRQWEAVGDDGINYGLSGNHLSEADQDIVSGSNKSIILHFEVPNGVKLTNLMWDWLHFESTIPIPSYEIFQSFNVSLDVQNVSIVASKDSCGWGDDNCHILNVTAVNQGILDFKEDRYDWKAIGDDGTTYNARHIEGGDIYPYTSGEVTLSFTVPEGIRLTSLQWDDGEYSLSCQIVEY